MKSCLSKCCFPTAYEQPKSLLISCPKSKKMWRGIAPHFPKIYNCEETDQESKVLASEERDKSPKELIKVNDTIRTSPDKDLLNSETANSHEYDGKD